MPLYCITTVALFDRHNKIKNIQIPKNRVILQETTFLEKFFLSFFLISSFWKFIVEREDLNTWTKLRRNCVYISWLLFLSTHIYNNTYVNLKQNCCPLQNSRCWGLKNLKIYFVSNMKVVYFPVNQILIWEFSTIDRNHEVVHVGPVCGVGSHGPSRHEVSSNLALSDSRISSLPSPVTYYSGVNVQASPNRDTIWVWVCHQGIYTCTE